MKTISIVIPTYNERENLPALVKKIARVFEDNRIVGEVIVVDDNSPDGTGEVADSLKKTYKFLRVIHRPAKLGLGSAYKEGFRVARGELIFTMDSDLSHNPSYLPRFLNAAAHADVIVGSRYVKGGYIVGWGLYRRLRSKIANFLAGLVIGGVKDVTSGYKAYQKRVLKQVPLASIRSSGYAFQLEMAYEIRGRGFKIDSVPIVFVNRVKGKSKLGIREIFSFLTLVIRLSLKAKRPEVSKT